MVPTLYLVLRDEMEPELEMHLPEEADDDAGADEPEEALNMDVPEVLDDER